MLFYNWQQFLLFRPELQTQPGKVFFRNPLLIAAKQYIYEKIQQYGC